MSGSDSKKASKASVLNLAGSSATSSSEPDQSSASSFASDVDQSKIAKILKRRNITFSTDCVAGFIESIKLVLQLERLNDLEAGQLALSSFDNKVLFVVAQSAQSLNVPLASLTWPVIESILETNYSGQVDGIKVAKMMQSFEMRQKPNETAYEYAHRLRMDFARIGSKRMSEEIFIGFVLFYLPTSAAHLLHSKIQSFDDLARELNIHESRSGKAAFSLSVPNTGDINYVNEDGFAHDCSKLSCFYCGKRGHCRKCCHSLSRDKKNGTVHPDVGGRKFSNGASYSKGYKKGKGRDEEANSVSSSAPAIMLNLSLNGRPMELLVDTGASVSLIHQKFIRPTDPVTRAQVNLSTAKVGGSLDVVGSVELETEIFGVSSPQIFYVISDLNHDGIIGRDLLSDRDLVIDSRLNMVLPSRQHQVSVVDFPDSPPPIIPIDQASTTNHWRDSCKFFNENLVPLEISESVDATTLFTSPTTEPARVDPIKLFLKKDALPTRSAPLHQGPVLAAELKEQVKKLEELDMIEKIKHHDWSSPAFLVKKGDSRFRMVINYRSLNSNLHDDGYPLPTPKDIFMSLGDSGLYTLLDLRDGFWNLPLDESSRHLTTFVTTSGIYQWKRLPQGLKTAPAIFQRVIDSLVGDMPNVRAYVDDILIFSKKGDVEAHTKIVSEVFRRLVSANLRANVQKAVLFAPSVDYLGFNVSSNGLAISESRISAIKNMKTPTDKKSLRSLLGFVGYLRSHIPKFSELVAPLQSMIPDDVEFKWSAELSLCLDNIKRVISTCSVLVSPDFSLPFVLETDASDIGVGGMLSQRNKPVSFFSQRLSATQRNYTTTDKELLAVVRSLEHFRVYLHSPFTLYTDHRNLVTLFTHRLNVNGRLARWLNLISSYDFEVIHKPGAQIPHVDYLSREIALETANFITAEGVHVDKMPIFTADDLRQRQRDIDFSAPPFDKYAEKFFVKAGIMYIEHDYGQNALIPIPNDEEVMQWHNSLGHMGADKMIWRLRQFVFFPGMYEHIKRVLETCDFCVRWSHKFGRARKNGRAQKMHRIGVFRDCQLDALGPLPSSNGYKYVLSLVDIFSGFHVLMALKELTSEVVIENLNSRVYMTYGFPTSLNTDNGSVFVSKVFEDNCSSLGIHHSTSSTYHPESNGVVERSNQFVAKALASVFENRSWTLNDLLSIQYCINTTPIRATGLAPFYCMFGRLPEVIPQQDHLVHQLYDLFTGIHAQAARSQNESVAQRVDKLNKSRKMLEFEIGDSVWLHDTNAKVNKLTKHQAWIAAKVTGKISDINYEVITIDDGIAHRAHISRLLGRSNNHEDDSESDEELPPSEYRSRQALGGVIEGKRSRVANKRFDDLE